MLIAMELIEIWKQNAKPDTMELCRECVEAVVDVVE